MIVLEATGIRDVASGPLLRLSHDRFVPGLRALVDEMRAGRRRPGHAADHRLPEDRHPQADARVPGGAWSARGQLAPSRSSPSPTRSSSATTPVTSTPRQRRDFLYGYRQTIEDLDLCRDPPDPRLVRRRRPPRAPVRVRRGRAALRARLHHGVVPVRHERAHGRLRRQLREPAAPAPGGDRGPCARRWGRDFLVGCRFLGSEDILGDDGRLHGNTLADAQAIARRARARRPRLPVRLARRQVRGRAAAAGRRGHVPLHRPQRRRCASPARARTRPP